MKLSPSILIASMVVTLTAMLSHAQAVPERTYKRSDGKTETITADGENRERRSTGQVDVLNEWKNRTEAGSRKYEPHNGQLPQEAFAAGTKWTHTYKVREGFGYHSRTRTCEVKAQGEIVVPAGTFADAWQVTCDNQRHDRPLPLMEVTWYTKDRILISHVESWGGSNPGSFSAVLLSPSPEGAPSK